MNFKRIILQKYWILKYFFFIIGDEMSSEKKNI